MELWIPKLLTVVFLFGLTLGFGLLPVWLVRTVLSSRAGPRATFVLSALNCVAGGVFLGTTFLHLLPDVQQSMAAVLSAKGIDVDRFHVAECVICTGFFVIMIMEHVLMGIQHHYGDVSMESVDSAAPVSSDIGDQGTDTAGHEGHDEETISVLGKALMKDDSVDTINKKQQKQHTYGYTNYGSTHSHVHKSGEHDACKNSAFSLHASHEKLASPRTKIHSQPSGEKTSPSATVTTVTTESRPKSLHSVMEEGGGSVHIIHSTHHQRHHLDGKQLKGIRSFVLLIALSLHTVFEGMALGLQSTSKEVWTLFAALAIHKSIIAFTLGLQFAEHVSRTSRVLLFVVFFSLMSPLGIIVGTLISETSAGYGAEVANAVLQGLATGTFIHVTFFEVLQREVGQDHNVLKVLAVIVGFVIIALMNFLVGT